MSSYLVEYETIDRILTAIRNTQSHTAAEMRQMIVDAGGTNEFGRKLLRMNVDALNARYQEKTSYADADAYEFHEKYADVHQFVKTIYCFIYQCAEGKIPKRKLYKKIDSFGDAMALSHFMEQKEFSKAVWR